MQNLVADTQKYNKYMMGWTVTEQIINTVYNFKKFNDESRKQDMPKVILKELSLIRFKT